MIRMIFLIDAIYSPNAGTERQLLGIIERLDRSWIEPHLMVLRGSDWLAGADLGCPVTVLEFTSFFGDDYWRCGRRFREYCRKMRIDIIQTFFHDSNILGTMWGRKSAAGAIVASRRSLGGGYWHSWKEIQILKYLRRHTDHYIANSRAAGEEAIRVEGLMPGQVSVVPNGLDVGLYRDPGPDSQREIRTAWGFSMENIVVGAVANLRPIKNLPFLIEAAVSLTADNPQLRFVVLGEGDQRSQLESLIAAGKLTDRFIMPGRSDDIAEQFFALDIAVLCSQSESLSNSVMEYMAAGRAVVVSDVGGNAELITSSQEGTIYASGDSAHFIEAVRSFALDADHRREVGRAARKFAERTFSWEHVMEQLQNLYESIARTSGNK